MKYMKMKKSCQYYLAGFLNQNGTAKINHNFRRSTHNLL